MSNTNASKPERAQRAAPERSSPGIHSPVQTPKDVEPKDAAARDVCERDLNASDPEERRQERLDDAVELSFPASDPPAVGGGTSRVDVPKEK